jgi:hypothetical protein
MGAVSLILLRGSVSARRADSSSMALVLFHLFLILAEIYLTAAFVDGLRPGRHQALVRQQQYDGLSFLPQRLRPK